MKRVGATSRRPRPGKPGRRIRRPRWTEEQVALLKRLYRSRSNAEIAKLLGRSVASVVFKGHRLGLSKGVRRLREMGRQNIEMRWRRRKRK